MASVREDNHMLCGGTIYTEFYIITTAACVNHITDPSTVHVYVGSIYSNAGIQYGISQLKAHQEYSFPHSNIGLIKTSTAIIFNSAVQPIHLHNKVILDGSKGILSGWGYTSYPVGSTPLLLKFLEVQTISNADCITKYSDVLNITDAELCALNSLGEGHGICIGDSGDPLVFQNKLIGFVSFSRGCAIGFPDGFTRITSFWNWIYEFAI